MASKNPGPDAKTDDMGGKFLMDNGKNTQQLKVAGSEINIKWAKLALGGLWHAVVIDCQYKHKGHDLRVKPEESQPFTQAYATCTCL